MGISIIIGRIYLLEMGLILLVAISYRLPLPDPGCTTLRERWLPYINHSNYCEPSVCHRSTIGQPLTIMNHSWFRLTNMKNHRCHQLTMVNPRSHQCTCQHHSCELLWRITPLVPHISPKQSPAMSHTHMSWELAPDPFHGVSMANPKRCWIVKTIVATCPAIVGWYRLELSRIHQ